MAFIFFNRYIDLYDAIDFENSDIPSPYEISLPEKNLMPSHERDRIRDWVLEINMDGNVGSQLPVRTCEYC
jgi:intraflagellar transport protein 172